MGEGHSNVTGHGSRGPTGGIKGGPTGLGTGNPSRGSGWGTSNTPYGKLHHYSPSQFGHNNRRGNRGGNRHSQSGSQTPSLTQRPDMQAYMAVGGVPAVVTLIDGSWGITLSRLSVVATFIETNLVSIGKWAARTSPIGVVVMGMMPSSIAPDPPMEHYFTTPVLPADRVTDIPKETLKTLDDVVVNVQLNDVMEEGVQQVVLIKNPTVTQRVPVVRAVPTATPNVYTAPVPGVTPVHINVVDSAEPGHQTHPVVAGKPTVTPIENAPVKSVTVSVGRHTRDAIIVFPDGTNIEPLYISMIRIISHHELREEARNAYNIARGEREAVESSLVQGPFNSVTEELGRKRTLVDKQVAEVAAHILLLEKNLILLNQEVAKVQQRLAFVLSPENRRTFKYVPEMRRLKATALIQQGEVNTLNQGIAELGAKQAALLALQQRVENERLAAEAAERQRIENARLAAEAAERQRVENARLAAEAAERQRVENARLAAEAAERQRVENERLAVETAKVQAERQEVIRQNTYSLPAHPAGSAYPPSFAVAGMGTLALGQEVMQGLAASLRMALVKLSAVATFSVAGPLAVTVAAAFYPVKVGEGSDQPPGWDRPLLAGSIPLSNMGLAPETGSAKQDDIELPVRMLITDTDGLMEVHAVKTGMEGVPAKVKVVAAQYDADKNSYTFTTDNQPPRTFTFTPTAPPGTDLSPALPQPASAPAAPLHTGETVIRHTVIHTVFPQPALEEQDFHDYIIWFPADSGLEPVYVYFKNPRYEPGTVTGRGQPVSGIWLAGAGKDSGVPIPAHIADQLRGRRFSTFDKFREAFWLAVGHDPELSGQFSPLNQNRMKKGYAPYPVPIEQIVGREKFELHHFIPIKDGGAVYDADNLRVVTPKNHINIHSKNGGKS
ncbi:S-type pyocin domain-containing protein [Yersinia aleksiciae]|uniref:S-type pyocin domain-containing protein n=1 Tax=Yersinia aleksiciae TaxID=263819 RepID=UPI001427D93E|nr:S-type pyocin domain-containing protein [Yersinia aleksiciae]MDA5499307.1 S-type pyocin domain-containing protein [Yersinia aleksiciae]NIL00331.1 colicin transporter [Yersinia aleksiciae]WQC70955.1 S-type pyocin domain-containing protein [Yersinia aleksiciae]